MAAQLLDTLRWQFRLTWQLAQYHLLQLTDEACLWEPAPGSWTVREAGGVWRPDWADAEPDPVPPVTIGWLTWHIIWWWSGLIAAVRDEPRVEREDVLWPSSAKAAVEQIEALSAAWSDVLGGLTDADLETPIPYPWREPRPLRIALAWANSELMKNIAEIGTVRHVRMRCAG
jgi:hypothetical protein